MWRPRDRERFIGGYDPEHEMPNPDRDFGDRYESDAYRHNARDGRFAYRMDPNRFERQFGQRDRSEFDSRWDRDSRDRGGNTGYRGSEGYRGDQNYRDEGYRGSSYGSGSDEAAAVKAGWDAVKVSVR